MTKKETENQQELTEDLPRERFKTILEWTGWGSLATLIAILAAMTLIEGVSLNSETSTLLIMSLYFWGLSWGTNKLVKENPDAWKHYFYWWIAAVTLGGALSIAGVTFIPT
ncbi:MAG: hypothetical protein Q6366_009635 [Candidatus Freyarchaeota archaeon]